MAKASSLYLEDRRFESFLAHRMAKNKSGKASHMEALNENITDVRRLLTIASSRNSYIDKKILRNGSVVLFTACWEAFIEDLADEGFRFLSRHAKTHNKLPSSVKRHVIKKLNLGKDPLELWLLADTGWKKILKKHGKAIIENWTGPLNTPNSKRVDEVFECLIGLKNLSNNWQWHGISSKDAKKKLDIYLSVRGQIAHRNSTQQTVTTTYVNDYTSFIYRLAVRSNNTVRKHLIALTKKSPWNSYSFIKTK